MKIKLLKQRENFNEIFVKSLNNYLVCKHNWEGSLGFKYIKGSKKFIVNDTLNVVYPYSIRRSKLSQITKEFSWNQNPFKSFFQKIYIYLSVRFPFEYFLSSSSFYITDNKKLLDDVVIIPGNHSIRLVDTINNFCTVICKDGFNKSLLIKDADVRIHHDYLKVPNVINLNVDNGWYEEVRIVGLPLNRLSSIRVKKLIISGVQNELKKLYDSTLVRAPSNVIIEYLIFSINNLVLDLPLNPGVRNLLMQIVSNLSSKASCSTDIGIYVCTSHGDLQSANILCNEENFWIIDWEYSAQRSIFYDAFVFEAESRFTSDFSERLFSIYNQACNGFDMFSWTGICFNKKNIHYIFIFLLEDILLNLEELSCNSITRKDESLIPYLHEINAFLQHI